MGKHIIKNNNIKKQLSVTLEGKFSEEEVSLFVADFQKEVSRVNPSTYELIFDSRKFVIMPQNLVPELKRCFTMYKEMNFKSIFINMGIADNIVQKMQITRIAREVGLENYTIE